MCACCKPTLFRYLRLSLDYRSSTSSLFAHCEVQCSGLRVHHTGKLFPHCKHCFIKGWYKSFSRQSDVSKLFINNKILTLLLLLSMSIINELCSEMNTKAQVSKYCDFIPTFSLLTILSVHIVLYWHVADRH